MQKTETNPHQKSPKTATPEAPLPGSAPIDEIRVIRGQNFRASAAADPSQPRTKPRDGRTNTPPSATIREIRVIRGQNSCASGATDSAQPGTKNEEPSTEAAAEVLAERRAERGEPNPSSKPCRTCRQELPLTAFYQQHGCRDGHRLDCKKCTARRFRKARAAAQQPPPETLRCRWCRQSKSIDEFKPDNRCRDARSTICAACYERALHDSRTQADLNVPDEQIIRRTSLYQRRIDLGFAIAAATFPPGHCCTYEELAAFTGLAPRTIQNIEQRALAKVRDAAVRLLRKKRLAELSLKEEQQ